MSGIAGPIEGKADGDDIEPNNFFHVIRFGHLDLVLTFTGYKVFSLNETKFHVPSFRYHSKLWSWKKLGRRISNHGTKAVAFKFLGRGGKSSQGLLNSETIAEGKKKKKKGMKKLFGFRIRKKKKKEPAVTDRQTDGKKSLLFGSGKQLKHTTTTLIGEENVGKIHFLMPSSVLIQDAELSFVEDKILSELHFIWSQIDQTIVHFQFDNSLNVSSSRTTTISMIVKPIEKRPKPHQIDQIQKSVDGDKKRSSL